LEDRRCERKRKDGKMRNRRKVRECEVYSLFYRRLKAGNNCLFRPLLLEMTEVTVNTGAETPYKQA